MEKRIELGGVPLIMYYSVNAMCEVEALIGKPIDEALENQFTVARLLLYGALIEKQPDMTLKRAGELMSEHIRRGGTLDDIVDYLCEALYLAGFIKDRDALA